MSSHTSANFINQACLLLGLLAILGCMNSPASQALDTNARLKLVLQKSFTTPIDTLSKSDVQSIKELFIADSELKSLTGLEYFSSLEKITIECPALEDWRALGQLKELVILEITNSNFQLEELPAIPQLKSLHLFHCETAMTDLQRYPALIELVIDGTQVHDLEFLQGIPLLEVFSAVNSNLIDASSVAILTQCEVLRLSQNKLAALPDFSVFQHLRVLELSSCGLSKLPSLCGSAPSLDRLHLMNNEISEIHDLSCLTELSQLLLSGNRLNDASELSNLTNLAILDLGDNKIQSCEFVGTLKLLRHLDLAKNSITSAHVIENLKELEILTLTSNPLDSSSEELLAQLRTDGVSVYY